MPLVSNHKTVALFNANKQSSIVKRLFLPRKPGVYAYAASAPIGMNSTVTTQRS